jgi:hypothetical protein
MTRWTVAALAVGGLLGAAGPAAAQGLEFRPIDTRSLVVQPTDTATNIFTGTTRYLSRVVADTIENNGFVRTINNLLGRRQAAPNTIQPGFSRLPDPRTYPSTAYQNSFTPALPTTQQFGQTPR